MAKITHGKRKTKTYKSWAEMKQRTTNPNNDKWKWYGGRGIKICDRWINSFENFLEDMGEKPQGYTLDRINNDGGYEPSNCRWADKFQQARNKRNNIFIEHDGLNLCLSEWATKLNLKVANLWARYNKGMKPPELFLPVGEIPRGWQAHKRKRRII